MILRLLFVLSLALLSNCGDESGLTFSQNTGCDTGTAVIGVYDSFLQVQCGCSEAAGTTAHVSSSLTCTVDAGTAVVFHYLSTSIAHRIISTDNSFVSSGVSDPNGEQTIKVHGVVFENLGTFPFEDQFNPELSGQIVVN